MDTAKQDRESKTEETQPWVLIVDDDAEMRAYLRHGLAALPFRVEEASGGIAALRSLQLASPVLPVLVISDVVMPEMDGLTLKAALRADDRLARVPVLLISGEAVRARDGPVLRKPFNLRRLHAAVRVLLES